MNLRELDTMSQTAQRQQCRDPHLRSSGITCKAKSTPQHSCVKSQVVCGHSFHLAPEHVNRGYVPMHLRTHIQTYIHLFDFIREHVNEGVQALCAECAAFQGKTRHTAYRSCPHLPELVL